MFIRHHKIMYDFEVMKKSEILYSVKLKDELGNIRK